LDFLPIRDELLSALPHKTVQEEAGSSSSQAETMMDDTHLQTGLHENGTDRPKSKKR
jgi:hypothetical protein